MAIPCFYLPELECDGVRVDLPETESAHALQSRRLKSGARINLINGRGLTGQAEIIKTTKRLVTVQVESVTSHVRSEPGLTIAVAMPKGDRQKVMVDMLTQLGVTTIIPLVSRYSVTNVKEAQIKKLQRLVIEACKQSQNPWFTEIAHPSSIAAVLDQAAAAYYANQGGDSISEYKNIEGPVTVLIGPEGGFSESEVDEFEKNEIASISVGQHILRTETAAIALASVFMSNDDG
ncbi:RsmE family RNA methyltransferase [Arenicella sp. 4NH20-0111]|uniref:RsmE family RNA methyltransferase n=1 Tax=Arenicella sp. 4NH20-0111 TaxID=3127648 RepID=UPI003105F0CC